MEIKPVKKINKPKYPQKEDVTTQDLKKSIPMRWIKNSAATIAISTLVVSTFAGCKPQPTAGIPLPPEVTTEDIIIDGALAGEPMINSLWVAPLFAHGEGRGSFGCVMIAPPVFLSEQEALEVINEIAKEYGLNFSDDETPTFHEVVQPSVNLYGTGDKKDSKDTMDLTIDFADKEHSIVIEFVSTDNVKEWKNTTEDAMASAGSYDTKEGAEQLQEGLTWSYNDDYNYYTAGVLYDPCAFVFKNGDQAFDDHDKIQEESRKESVSKLKNQAKDFFEWLKSQGVI